MAAVPGLDREPMIDGGDDQWADQMGRGSSSDELSHCS
ncbi:hypothetical protein RISK_001046 [Rhodopirellula islandica]|uniref:Uncharacterized protein n=1 Tax=Rhodopirellula islandica TaxID=595434 RepID=A0A0J1BL43_RHOIS|nr:hypothetical protein RISK_001046 [Rhodopirellula islandica]